MRPANKEEKIKKRSNMRRHKEYHDGESYTIEATGQSNEDDYYEGLQKRLAEKAPGSNIGGQPRPYGATQQQETQPADDSKLCRHYAAYPQMNMTPGGYRPV